MIEPGPSLAALALGEYRQRHAAACRKVAACELDRGAADRLLYPWLALALRLGADPGELHLQAARVVEDYRRANLTDRQACSCAADDICPLPAVRQALAAARDARLGRNDARTLTLVTLAIAIGCPPTVAAPQLEAA